jgi:hypothetical protein
MNIKRPFVVLISTLLGTVLITTSFAADVVDPDGAFATPNDAEPGQHNVLFADQTTGEYGSMLFSWSRTSDPKQDPTCTSLLDEKCQGSDLEFKAIIPMCQSQEDINCVESLVGKREDGSELPATFDRYFPSKAQNAFDGSPANRLPTGATSSILNIQGAEHKGGSKYLVTVYMTGRAAQGTESKLLSFSATVTPVQVKAAPAITGSCGVASCPDAGWAFNEKTPEQGWRQQAPGFDGVHSCAATSVKEGLCAHRFGFPENIRFVLKVRINNAPTGWMHGRMADPVINLSESKGVTSISIDAAPVRVPVVYKSNKWSELPREIQRAYSAETGYFLRGFSGGFTRIDGGVDQSNPLKRNWTSTPSPSGEGGLEELKLWLPYIKDKATATPSSWSVRTLDSSEAAGANTCFKSGSVLTGIVTTNSTQYAAGPPVFDKSEGSLVYKVAAPHYDAKDAVFKGRYSLVMRSDVARCVYGFSKAPVKAELSIVSSDGTPQIATIVVGESNGWLRLRADNFEFSAPTIKAKLTQEAEVTATNSGSQSPLDASQTSTKKKSTITCIKGKQIKKVTSVSPKCPVGFKKKV